MRRVFADTYYWIAILNDNDEGHAAAQSISQTLQGAEIVTTDEVLSEFLAHFSGHGPAVRQVAIQFVESVLSDPAVTVRPQSHQTFLEGLALYKARLDKGYSLTDCASMEAMRQEGISEVLTHDSHFSQERFVILL
jgi:predicted nucleic acid-binding protein